MAKYIYKGRSKIITQVPKRRLDQIKPISEECTFVLMSAYPLAGIKKFGPPLGTEEYGEETLNLHLDLINSVCKRPNIIVIGGYEVRKIFKHPRRNEFQVIENTLYEFTNSCEDLRIGLNATPRGPIIMIDAAFLPSVDTYKYIFSRPEDSLIAYSVRKSDCVGVNVNSEGKINYFGYSCEKKVKGIYSINLNDFDRLRKKCIGSSFNKNKFDYEILQELKIYGFEDTSKSLRLDENYDKNK